MVGVESDGGHVMGFKLAAWPPPRATDVAETSIKCRSFHGYPKGEAKEVARRKMEGEGDEDERRTSRMEGN